MTSSKCVDILMRQSVFHQRIVQLCHSDMRRSQHHIVNETNQQSNDFIFSKLQGRSGVLTSQLQSSPVTYYLYIFHTLFNSYELKQIYVGRITNYVVQTPTSKVDDIIILTLDVKLIFHFPYYFITLLNATTLQLPTKH